MLNNYCASIFRVDDYLQDMLHCFTNRNIKIWFSGYRSIHLRL